MVNEHLDRLLRTRQLDLSQLDRSRLEELFIALLDGQTMIYNVLSTETQQSSTIEAQREAIESLHVALGALNKAPEQNEAYRANALTALKMLPEALKEDREAAFYKAYFKSIADLAVYYEDVEEREVAWLFEAEEESDAVQEDDAGGPEVS
jgi:hypothetical protein